MKTKTAFALVATLASVASLASIGCGSSAGSSGGGTDNAGTTRASLHRAKGCGDLLGDLKGDAAYKVNRAIDRQIENILACIRHYGDTQCAGYAGFSVGGGGGGGIAEGAPAMNAGAAPAPSAPMAGDSAATGSSSGSSGTSGGSTSTAAPKASASSYSDTNTQVKGVDEADIVKNDGNNIYLIHGNDFKVINAWPANALKEAGSIQIEGNPTEMFVQDGKVVVYSQVNGAAIFQAAGVTPKTSYMEYGYGYALDAPQAGNSKAGTPSIAPMPPGGGGTYPAPITYAPLTKITVLTLNGTTPVVARESYYEGNYLDSRRVGPQVRTVLQSYQYGPQLKFSIYELQPPTPMTDPAMPNAGSTTSGSTGTGYVDVTPKTGSETIAQLEQLRAMNLKIIDATQLPDWLPYTFVKNGNVISAKTVACEDFYVPTVGSTQGGMTEVTSIDLGNPAAEPRATAILGQANTVYASADTLYVAANAWVEPPFVWYDNGFGYAGSGTVSGGVATPPSTGTAGSTSGSGGTAVDAGAAKPANVKPLDNVAMPAPVVVSWASSKTHVHKFDFSADPGFANYVASGTVVGSVKDQFSLDDKDGYLRVVTSENRQYVTVEGNYFPYETMTPEQNNGVVPPHPYLLNHLFVLGQNGPWLDVTGDGGDIGPNEQVDSVRFVESRGYVVTFRRVDPLFVFDLSNPRAPNLLASLTISGFSEYMQPMDPDHLLTIGRAADPVTGRTQGLQLQIFDVSNGAKPAVVQRFTYTGSEYGSSDAEYDHKAFTWFPEKGLLAFPYYAYNPSSPTGMRSSLEVFHVDVAGGFAKLGSVDVTSLVQKAPTGYCGGYFQPSVRRGVFLENFVYAVAYAGIVARDSNNLAAAGTQLALPAPELNQGYGPSCVVYGAPTPATALAD